MIQKLKECKNCKVPSKLFSKGLCKLCWTKLFAKPIKRDNKLHKISQNEKERQRKYRELSRIYLLEHSICEVCGTKKSEEIHHKAGRIGNNLFQHFLAVCRLCHRKVEENPTWAKENNFSISRIKDV